MLKLIYQTTVFGPIDLEYSRPIIRVGSDESNDLVLHHPSINPFHGILVFRGEKVMLLPASPQLPAESDLPKISAAELGLGDELWIGDVQFHLAHSPNTVALPDPPPPNLKVQRQYRCDPCQMQFPETSVRTFGLVGRPPRTICPRCGRTVAPMPA